jgi:hypothetical protein
MNVLDKFLHSIAYKFPKGYPDMEDEQDKIILENEFTKIGITLNEILSPNAQQAVDILKKEFDLKDEDIVSKSSTNFKVLMDDNERRNFLKKASNLEDFEFDFNDRGSSVGRLKYQPEDFKKPILIYAKPSSAQGLGSAGKRNEFAFNSLINSKVEENGSPITVIFKSSNKNIKISNVNESVDSSKKDASAFAKADSQFLSTSNAVLANISLKKRNAVRWESSKTRIIDGVNIFKSFIEKVGKIGTENEIGDFDNVVLTPYTDKETKLTKEGKYRLFSPKMNKGLAKVVIINVPRDIEEDIIFGKVNSNEPKTIVVKETFEGGYDDYTFNNGVLTINCFTIYTDIEDLNDTLDEPIFALSNHVGQSYGIEFRSFSKGFLYKDQDLRGASTEINFNDLK